MSYAFAVYVVLIHVKLFMVYVVAGDLMNKHGYDPHVTKTKGLLTFTLVYVTVWCLTLYAFSHLFAWVANALTGVIQHYAQ